MSEIAKIAANWTEGWRVFGRFIWFQAVSSVFLLPLSGVYKMFERYVAPPFDLHPSNSAKFATIALVLFGALIYLPFALFSASQVTGQLKGKAQRYPWADSPPYK